MTGCPLWVKSGHVQRKSHVCFTPKSGHVQCTSRCPLCANSGLMRCINYRSTRRHVRALAAG